MILKKIISDYNKQFEEAWHFCKFKYSYSILLDFEIPEEEVNLATAKLDEMPLAGKDATNEYKCLIS